MSTKLTRRISAGRADKARPALELWTYGLKDRSETESSPEVRCDRDRVVTFADSLLRQAAEGGAVAREDAEMLAREWLAISGADLAMGVLMGGKHQAAQLIELCGCVLRTHGGRVRANEYGGRRRERARAMTVVSWSISSTVMATL
jgi:hypothetical protein